MKNNKTNRAKPKKGGKKAAERTGKSVRKSATKPVKKSGAKSTTESVRKSSVKSTTKSVRKAGAKSTTRPVSKPAGKLVSKPGVKPAAKPAGKFNLKRIFKTKLGVAACVLIILVAASGIFIHTLSSTSLGVVNVGAPIPSPGAVDFGNLVALDGKYIDFNYPAAFNQLKADPPSGTVLATYLFSKPPVPYWNLGIAVDGLPTGKLADSTQYAYRLARPAEFTPETLMSRQRSIVVMSDSTAPFSKTAFMVNGNELATITLTGGSMDTTQLQRTLQLVIDSFVWMQPQ